MTHDDLLHSLRTQLTVPVWPHAGKALGYKTKSAAYAAAARGAIQTIPDMGRKRPVATAWLRSVLFVEKFEAPGRAHRRRKKAAPRPRKAEQAGAGA
jgi:hypothetical protein